jgi:dTDP-4-amino-4,6-dideoxygalactose transaminase
MSEVNAAIGLVQLARSDGFIDRRREIARRYDAGLAGLPGIRPLSADYRESAPHIYVIRVADSRRDELMSFLGRFEIETAVSYIPNHLQPLFRENGLVLPATEAAFDEILTLPLHCALSDADVARVIERVRMFAAGGDGEWRS